MVCSFSVNALAAPDEEGRGEEFDLGQVVGLDERDRAARRCRP